MEDPNFTAPKSGIPASLLLATVKRSLAGQWYYANRPKALSRRIGAINALIRRTRKLVAGEQEVLEDLPQASLQYLLRQVREEGERLESSKHPFRRFLNTHPIFLDPEKGVVAAQRELEAIEQGLTKVLREKMAVARKRPPKSST